MLDGRGGEAYEMVGEVVDVSLRKARQCPRGGDIGCLFDGVTFGPTKRRQRTCVVEPASVAESLAGSSPLVLAPTAM